jgi:hypothetical protein
MSQYSAGRRSVGVAFPRRPRPARRSPARGSQEPCCPLTQIFPLTLRKSGFGPTLRAALEALAVAAPGWLTGGMGPSWQQVYGARIDDLHLPGSPALWQGLMVRYGADGYYLLEQVHGPGAPAWLREPGEHLVDSGYPSVELIVHADRMSRITLVFPMLLDSSAQARGRRRVWRGRVRLRLRPPGGDLPVRGRQ